MDISTTTTFGQLRTSGFKTKSIREELRSNLIESLRSGKNPFEGIHGYDDTVIPDLQKAILSRHNIILLGLRGQAKTRIARLMIRLLDEYIPAIKGSEIHDNPFSPVSKFGKDMIAEHGDSTPIEWIHRDQRYTEKLATPDVSTADLIGDVDPIKAASLKLPYSDERVIHFGLIPRSNRSIFVINELPDLQARIQVALFNILQEEDIQIRGFKMRLPLDILFVFTANPEDYTNRGSIVTPLKDRIDSQILTHYPKDRETARLITIQEAKITPEQKAAISIDPLLSDLIEQIAFEARSSEFVDPKSGVSARLTISAYENLFSTAERRMLISGESSTSVRISDLYGIIPSITGKVELVYEGEQEGPTKVAVMVIGKAIRTLFRDYFSLPEKIKKEPPGKNPYREIIGWFNKGNKLDILNNLTNSQYIAELNKVTALSALVAERFKDTSYQRYPLLMEFLLHGLAEYSQLSKYRLEGGGVQFKDLISSMFTAGSASADEPDLSDEEFYK
ncbi:MAG: magnesium chelatase [Ignavibacteriaceae bacterium]|nr:magnesium chelatase [Ignavibacteriaceae bacterium]